MHVRVIIYGAARTMRTPVWRVRIDRQAAVILFPSSNLRASAGPVRSGSSEIRASEKFRANAR